MREPAGRGDGVSLSVAALKDRVVQVAKGRANYAALCMEILRWEMGKKAERISRISSSIAWADASDVARLLIGKTHEQTVWSRPLGRR